MTTNFSDGFILASPRELSSSSACGMELVFMLTRWEYAREGRKPTEFDIVCKALGVEFNLAKSPSFVMEVTNIASRAQEPVKQIQSLLTEKKLS